jgi:hypothetical protein
MVEKAHEWTVCDERYNPFRFIICGFETANPAENDHSSQTQHAETKPIEPSGHPIEGSDDTCVLVLNCAGQGFVSGRSLCRCTNHMWLLFVFVISKLHLGYLCIPVT